MAQLTCGNELRRRLEELNGGAQPVQFESLRNERRDGTGGYAFDGGGEAESSMRETAC
jgi:hypothetical protein